MTDAEVAKLLSDVAGKLTGREYAGLVKVVVGLTSERKLLAGKLTDAQRRERDWVTIDNVEYSPAEDADYDAGWSRTWVLPRSVVRRHGLKEILYRLGVDRIGHGASHPGAAFHNGVRIRRQDWRVFITESGGLDI